MGFTHFYCVFISFVAIQTNTVKPNYHSALGRQLLIIFCFVRLHWAATHSVQIPAVCHGSVCVCVCVCVLFLIRLLVKQRKRHLDNLFGRLIFCLIPGLYLPLGCRFIKSTKLHQGDLLFLFVLELFIYTLLCPLSHLMTFMGLKLQLLHACIKSVSAEHLVFVDLL